jgi:type II secretory pathway component GspD/PulD (secretin)
VRQVLELLSRQHGLNILVAPGVQGRVTANLEGLDSSDALRAILKLCDLVAQHEEGLTYVFSRAELPDDGLEQRFFPLDYASADDLMPAIEGLLSPAGTAFVTNSNSPDRKTREAIMVVDALGPLSRIEQYLTQADQAPCQVMIEAHVLEVDLEDELKHGINFRRLFDIANTTVTLDITGFAAATASPAVFAHVKGDQVNNLVELLKSTTDAKMLASPRILVVGEETARIQVGERLGYKIVTVTETSAVEEVNFLEVGVVLEVTPRIGRDGRVLLQVKPKVSKGEINPETLLPEEETTEVETKVLLENGQGVVIGGLIQEKDSDIQSKVPCLGDLWVIGRLFQKRQRVKERTELVVTLVPHVVECGGLLDERNIVDAERSQAPLFQGPLNQYPRPWEAVMPDAIHNPKTLCIPRCRRNAPPCRNSD